jgi:cytochrome oxidase assembly protein ShyY1
MTLFAALLLPVVLSLGSWQLERAEEKRRFEAAYLDRIGALAAAPGPAVADFQRIRLVGSYQAGHDFLLDNQTRDGQIGYGVISLFRAEDGRGWLVNRGFLPGDRARRSRPEVRTPEGTVSLVGLVWPELGLLPVFGEDRWSEGWPKLIQRLEVARMAAAAENVMANEVRLEPAQPGVFDPAPTELNMPAAKHTGYAVQWFGLAAALAIGFVVFGFRNK